MAENDFYLLSGNQYRGSRYSNFAGGGIDPQGNVSSAINENYVTQSGTFSDRPQQPEQFPQGASDIPTGPSRNLVSTIAGETAPKVPSLTNTVTNLGISAGVPAATTAIGSSIGQAVALGTPVGEGLTKGLSALTNKVSAGLLGTANTPVNAATGALGKGVYGPPTASSVSKAASGGNVGGAIGSGLGSAAATLLTGGTVKQAATSGLGSATGFYLGNAIAPGIGGIVGSFLGSTVGGLFGGSGKVKRQTVAAQVLADSGTGRFKTGAYNTKGVDKNTAKTFADEVGGTLNKFGDALGLKYKANFNFEGNIGSKDQKTVFGGHVINNKPLDYDSIVLSVLKNNRFYDYSDPSISDWWGGTVKGASNVSGLASSVNDYLSRRRTSAGQTQTAANQVTQNSAASPGLVALSDQDRVRYNFAT